MLQEKDFRVRKISAAELHQIPQKKRILSASCTIEFTCATELIKYLNTSLRTCTILLNDLVPAGYVKNFGRGEPCGGPKPSLYFLPEDEFYSKK